MGGTWSRIKSWATGETLTASDLNAEFNNVISNATPTGTDDHSSTTGQMDTTSDPYPGSSQTQATSLAGELEQLRYVIDEMHGGAKWYISRELLALAGGTMTGALVLPAGSAAAPAIGIGAVDTGLYKPQTDHIGISLAGTQRWNLNGNIFFGINAAGPAINNVTASSTVPTLVPNRADTDTGIGWDTDELHIIINGSSAGYFDSTGIVVSGIAVSSALGAGAATANTLYTENTTGGWAHWTGATPPVKVDDFNVSGVTRTSTGLFVISWDTDFADANYFVVVTARHNDNAFGLVQSVTAGSVTVEIRDHNGNVIDPTALYVMAMGAQ
jgi:hypothetical protein